MRKLFLCLVLAGLMFGPVFALTSANINDADVSYDQGYFVGVFYKDIETGFVYKVDRITDDTIYLTNFENGELLTEENSEKTGVE